MAQTQPNESECLTFSTQDPISLHFSRFGLYTNKGSQYNTLKYYLKTHLNFDHHIFSINTLVQKYHKTRVESILVQPLHGPKSQVIFTEWEENSQVDSHQSPCLAPILPHHPASWGVLQLILLTNVLEQPGAAASFLNIHYAYYKTQSNGTQVQDFRAGSKLSFLPNTSDWLVIPNDLFWNTILNMSGSFFPLRQLLLKTYPVQSTMRNM